MNGNLKGLILKALALGMAIATLVLNILGEAEVKTSIILLSIGLISLALNELEK